jgi:hypothetical protein
MEFQQAGLFDHWESGFNPMPPQCLATTKSGNQKQETKPSVIKLSNLTGAFAVLLIGFSASFLIFLFELKDLNTSTSKQPVVASNRNQGK